LKTSSD